MADNASIARPYAKAVFELAQETENFDGWSTALELLSSISSDQEFSVLVNDPKIGADNLVSLLTDICQDKLPEGGTNFINLLVQNGRLNAVADVKAQFDDMVAQAKKSVNAHVQTAFALTDEQKTALSSALEKRLGLKVNLEETVDADLVGGAIITAGDLVIDGSAKGRIEKLVTVLAR